MPIVVIIGFAYQDTKTTEGNQLLSTITDIYQVYSYYRSLGYKIYIASDISTVIEPDNIGSLCASKIVDLGFKDFLHHSFLSVSCLVKNQIDLELFFNSIRITTDRNAIVYYTGHGVKDHILLSDNTKYSALELRYHIMNIGVVPLPQSHRVSSDDVDSVRSIRNGLNSVGSCIFIIFDCCNPHGLYLPFEMNRTNYTYDFVGSGFTLPEIILITSSEPNRQSQAKRGYSMFTKELFEIFKAKSKRYDFHYIISTLDVTLDSQKAMVRASTPCLKIPWSWVTTGVVHVEGDGKTMFSAHSVDHVFHEYRISKFALLDNPTPEKIAAFVTPDNGCVRRMGHGDGSSGYACTRCLQIGRLTDMDYEPPSSITIETGSMQGVTFGITEKENVLYDVKWDDQAPERFDAINSVENLSLCGLSGNSKASRYLSSDTWLNEALISWQIERILTTKNLPHINPVMIAYVCGGRGFTIDCDGVIPLTDKTMLSEKDALTILTQLGSFLLALKSSLFVHGSLTMDKIGWIDHPCGYEYMGNEVEGEFTLYFHGFHMSSINVAPVNHTTGPRGNNRETIRLIPSTRGRGVDLEYAVSQFKPVIKRCSLGDVGIGEEYENVCKADEDLLYQYVDNGPVLFTTMRYSGFPIFGGGFDLYTVLISLLSWKPFRCAVSNSEVLTAIIRKMFPGKFPTIKEADITCSYKVATCLSGVWLYCNAVEKLFEFIRIYVGK